MKSANNLPYAKVVLNGYEKAKNGKSVCVITKNDGSCGDYVMLVYGKPAVVGGIIHAMDFSFGSMAPDKKVDWLYYDRPDDSQNRYFMQNDAYGINKDIISDANNDSKLCALKYTQASSVDEFPTITLLTGGC